MESTLPGDIEIALKLMKRTTPELLAFQEKLNRMPEKPQAMAIRFHIVNELMGRCMASTSDSEHLGVNS